MASASDTHRRHPVLSSNTYTNKYVHLHVLLSAPLANNFEVFFMVLFIAAFLTLLLECTWDRMRKSTQCTLYVCR